jgi:hypothetical protein
MAQATAPILDSTSRAKGPPLDGLLTGVLRYAMLRPLNGLDGALSPGPCQFDPRDFPLCPFDGQFLLDTFGHCLEVGQVTFPVLHWTEVRRLGVLVAWPLAAGNASGRCVRYYMVDEHKRSERLVADRGLRK